MSKLIRITNKNEYIDFKKNHPRAVIFYGAEWCEACTEIKPLYIRVANRYYQRVTLGYVDIEECKLDFSVIPIFVSFRNGEQLNSMEGADRKALKEFIKEVIQIK